MLPATRARSPFLGLAMAAAAGIISADYFPAINPALLLLGLAGALCALRWPFPPLLFAVVSAGFFSLHSSRLLHNSADALAEFAGTDVCAISASGVVTTEPKIKASGLTSFLFRLKQAQTGAQTLNNNAEIYVRWRGASQIGDELALFGTLRPI